MRLLIPLLLVSFISYGQKKEKQNYIETEVKVEYIYNSNSSKGLLYTIDSNSIYLINSDQLRKLKRGHEISIAEAKLVPITSVHKIFTRPREKRVRSLIFGASIGLIFTIMTFPKKGDFLAPLSTLVSIFGGSLSTIIGAAIGSSWGGRGDYYLIQGESENYVMHYNSLKALCVKK